MVRRHRQRDRNGNIPRAQRDSQPAGELDIPKNGNGNVPQESLDSPKSAAATQTEDRFHGFLKSLGEVLEDFTALEVNTMIVSNISGNKFSAYLAYTGIYDMRRKMREDPDIPPDTKKRYRSILERLQVEYNICFGEHEAAELPNPHSPGFYQVLEKMEQNSRFRRSLRKLNEQKAAIDSGDIHSETVDLIYAQTVMQLDGDVINRYHEKLFSDPKEKRDLILQIHNEGVEAGEEQWKGLLNFIVDLTQNILQSFRKQKVLKSFKR